MPDLLIKENELVQLQSMIGEIPTKYGINLIGFIGGVTKKRNDENAQLEKAKQSLDLAAAKQASSNTYPSTERLIAEAKLQAAEDQARKELRDNVTFQRAFAKVEESLEKRAKTRNGHEPFIGEGPNGPETQSQRDARVKAYSDHVGLGDVPQGKGCFPCEEAGSFRDQAYRI